MKTTQRQTQIIIVSSSFPFYPPKELISFRCSLAGTAFGAEYIYPESDKSSAPRLVLSEILVFILAVSRVTNGPQSFIQLFVEICVRRK